jgi:hypothetical protein
MASRSITVAGHEIPRRRFTRHALLYFLGLVALPILGTALALDVLFYYLAAHLFGTCYGVLCLL